jgi:thymidylate kinase
VPIAVIAALGDDVPGALIGTAAWKQALGDENDRVERLRRTAVIVEDTLMGIAGLALGSHGLGWAWSLDVDVFATPDALATASVALRDAGAIDLDDLIARFDAHGRRQRPSTTRHFAILEGVEVLAPVELSTVLWDRGEPAAPAISRAVASDGLPRLMAEHTTRRRLAKLAVSRRPTVRGAVELSALLERGETLPAGTATVSALHRHAALERTFVGPGPLSEAAASFRPRVNREWAESRLHAGRRRGATRVRARQFRVAFCGIDGAGKSTQVDLLLENLERAGVSARASWTRLGNGSSSALVGLTRVAQRLLPSGTHSFQATRAAAGRQSSSSAPDPHTRVPGLAAPLTRRGLVGWSWALAVTLDYLVRSRAARRRANGSVLVLDRALPDALVELEDDYGIVLRLSLQRLLLTRFTPKPHMTFYLQLPGAVAKARKDDMFTALELEEQTRRYGQVLDMLPNVVMLNAQKSRQQLALEVLRAIASPAAGTPSGA